MTTTTWAVDPGVASWATLKPTVVPTTPVSGRKVALGARWAALKHRPLRGSRDRPEDVVAPGVRDRAALKFAYESPVGYPALTPARVAPRPYAPGLIKARLRRDRVRCPSRCVVPVRYARAGCIEVLILLLSDLGGPVDPGVRNRRPKRRFPAFAPGYIEACARRAGPVAIEVHPVFAPGHIEARYR